MFSDSEIDKNELAKVEKYTLNVECQKPDNVDDFERMLREFAQEVVNRADYGENKRVVFYKANIYKRMTDDGLNHRYTFHFFLYSGRFWDTEIHDDVNRCCNTDWTKMAFKMSPCHTLFKNFFMI